MEKKYSKDEILKSFKNAPPAVREILSSAELSELLYDLSEKNSLSKENMILVAESNRNLLLGLTSPAEVLGKFIFAGIQAEKAQKILEELNQKIFIPTHKKMLTKESMPEHKQETTEIADTEKPIPDNHTIQTETQSVPPTTEVKMSAPAPKPPEIQIEHHQNVPEQEEPAIESKEVENKKVETPDRKYVVDPYRESF